ncbi:MAG: potassium-transporting ATPase subunit KdpA [Acinetobacter sp.]
MLFFLILTVVCLLGIPLGKYLACIMQNQPMKSDVLFHWIEKPIYALLGTQAKQGMNIKNYVLCFALSQLTLGLVVWLMLMFQAILPLNPDHAPNMSWDLALHTMISFLTNTDQQHYSGQSQLSYLSQMVAIVGLQIISPMMGLAIVVATIRVLFTSAPQVKSDEQIEHDKKQTIHSLNIGNYWADIIRPTLRFFLPLCLLWSLLLSSQGVPATFNAGPEVKILDATAQVSTQKIPLGPVAPMVAVKQLGSNGGGWYGPNSAAALENPTQWSNVLELVAILLIPITVIVMLGFLTKRKKIAVFVFGTMLLMSVLSTILTLWSEAASMTSGLLSSMEGKEIRFAESGSALWAALTTQVNNGSVNMMMDSSAPLTGLMSLMNMLINAIWGGIGCGLQQFIIYLILAVFIAGLMTGRTPELLGRKIEAREIKLLSVVILLQPAILLILTAIALSFPSLTGNSNPASHGISQVFYEYVSAFANNGSGFEGLSDNSVWWNLSTSVTLLAGRYPTLIIPLLIAGYLAVKPQAPESQGSLQVETITFAFTLIAIVVMLTLLQFMPVLVLGPVADHLMLMAK